MECVHDLNSLPDPCLEPQFLISHSMAKGHWGSRTNAPSVLPLQITFSEGSTKHLRYAVVSFHFISLPGLVVWQMLNTLYVPL